MDVGDRNGWIDRRMDGWMDGWMRVDNKVAAWLVC